MTDDDAPEEESKTRFERLVLELATLQVNVGIMGSVMEQYPEHVQRNFDQRVDDMVEWARNQTVEVQEFGSAFDE